MSLNILSSSINLIYSNINDIVASLESGLGAIQNEKQAENSSISINYLATSENTKRLLQGTPEELKVLVSVFEQCSKIKSRDLVKLIEAQGGLTAETIVLGTPSNLVKSASKFTKSLTESLIVSYCALSESLSTKSQVATSQNAERDEKDKQRQKEFENLIAIFYSVSADKIREQLHAMRETLAKSLNEKAHPKEGSTEGNWDNVNE
jgi:hypothetical protein